MINREQRVQSLIEQILGVKEILDRDASMLTEEEVVGLTTLISLAIKDAQILHDELEENKEVA